MTDNNRFANLVHEIRYWIDKDDPQLDLASEIASQHISVQRIAKLAKRHPDKFTTLPSEFVPRGRQTHWTGVEPEDVAPLYLAAAELLAEQEAAPTNKPSSGEPVEVEGPVKESEVPDLNYHLHTVFTMIVTRSVPTTTDELYRELHNPDKNDGFGYKSMHHHVNRLIAMKLVCREESTRYLIPTEQGKSAYPHINPKVSEVNQSAGKSPVRAG